ncbi:hypothetical protein KUTeg_023197 [Tegillarca granosa]|uniref:Uncharacterized protein n=1 Tax=Tegillarca granosa TaxID=220873 RepID=A0ABQ9E1I7_TEGGR|nr:hypothetical protein KUTeg_023197 [Tegillarca granosa]
MKTLVHLKTFDNKKHILANASPQPILPRPCMYSSAALQTYALIPIQNVGQNVQQAISGSGTTNQPMIVQVPPENNNNTQNASVNSSVQQMMEQADIQRKIKKKKMITIAPKAPLTSSNDSSVNIVKQAWLDAQNLTSDSDTEWATLASKTPSTQIEEKIENMSPEKELHAKKAKIKLPLPKPKFFNKKTPPSKKTRSRRKQTLVAKERSLMHDSSDEESDFIANLEKELPTPLKNILDKTEKSTESMATSTPFKSMGFSSPQLPSPIQGFTPLKKSMFMDGLFLDSDTDGKGFVISPDILRYKKMSPSVLRTPDSPNLDFNITPIKSSNMHDISMNNGHSLSKFIAEFPIDSELMEEGDGLPADLSNLNWSVGQQLDNDS